jgi:multiple sugar transport system ATP-binding protein
MVFQSYALYPQMTVEKNLSFGLRVAGMPKAEIDQRVARAAEILQIQPLLQRKPANLSGGQRQRVAIGRALVRDVDVFLFDEPLSNLDAKLRSDLRVEIKRLHQRLKNTMIYVTHDQIEALTLADRIAIMKNGVIQQLADPHTIYNKPTNLYVAGFIGSPSMNFIPGTVDGTTFTAEDGTAIPVGIYDFVAPASGATKAVLGVRPEHILLGDASANMPFKTQAVIEIVEPMGSETLAWTKVAGIPVTFRCSSDIPLAVGDRVTLGFDIARGSLFNAQTENRL